MNAELQEFKDLVDKSVNESEPGALDGRDEDGARRLADLYVQAHPEQFTQMESMDLTSLVKVSQMFRDNGAEEAHQTVEVWLRHRYPPQKIGGTFEPGIRIPTTATVVVNNEKNEA